MIGDPIAVSKNDFDRAKIIYENIKDKNIILIGGGSGTKKSELAVSIQNILSMNSKSSFVVSLDDYYLIHSTIRNINRKKLGLDSVGISEIDWESIYRIYEDFKNKREIHFKRTHQFLDAIEHNTIASEEIDYLIIEGLYSNYLRKQYNDNISIFLEGTPQETLAFRKMRQKENEDNIFRQKVVQKEFNVVVQLKRYADIILEFRGNNNE